MRPDNRTVTIRYLDGEEELMAVAPGASGGMWACRPGEKPRQVFPEWDETGRFGVIRLHMPRPPR